jgi:hypothetical protein
MTRVARFIAPALLPLALLATGARQVPPDLTADVRIYESAITHNSYPDECDMRLQRLYVAEDSEVSIEVQFSRDLSDEESQAVQWEVSDGAAQPPSGDFSGQSNPALVTTTLTAPADSHTGESLVHVTYEGVDLVPPLPVRVISNAEYDAAYSLLTVSPDRADSADRLPLTSDLLARFLGEDSTAAGVPSVGTEPLNICDPRLTHRAGADWGSETVTDVPLVHYGPDQPAAEVVARGVAAALLRDNESSVRQYFASNPGERSHRFDFSHDGNLTLNYPLDALLALHGVQFAGTVSAIVAAPDQARSPLQATDVHVTGTVGDVYDFNLEASGIGAAAAHAAAKIEIGSSKHQIGKVFLVSFTLDNTLPSLVPDRDAS